MLMGERNIYDGDYECVLERTREKERMRESEIFARDQ